MNRLHEVRFWSLLIIAALACIGNYSHLLRIRELEQQTADHVRRIEWIELQALMARNRQENK